MTEATTPTRGPTSGTPETRAALPRRAPWFRRPAQLPSMPGLGTVHHAQSQVPTPPSRCHREGPSRWPPLAPEGTATVSPSRPRKRHATRSRRAADTHTHSDEPAA
eukprot:2989642-Prymnesium_polylepis.1